MHWLAILDLFVKVRNYWYEIQISAQALYCKNIGGEDFADQAVGRGKPEPERSNRNVYHNGKITEKFNSIIHFIPNTYHALSSYWTKFIVVP